LIKIVLVTFLFILLCGSWTPEIDDYYVCRIFLPKISIYWDHFLSTQQRSLSPRVSRELNPWPLNRKGALTKRNQPIELILEANNIISNIVNNINNVTLLRVIYNDLLEIILRGGVNQYLQINKFFISIIRFIYATLVKGTRVCTQLLLKKQMYI